MLFTFSGFIIQPDMAAKICIRFAVLNEHACNKYTLSYRTLARAGNLEALTRMRRETVKVQAVIPVRSADQR